MITGICGLFQIHSWTSQDLVWFSVIVTYFIIQKKNPKEEFNWLIVFMTRWERRGWIGEEHQSQKEKEKKAQIWHRFLFYATLSFYCSPHCPPLNIGLMKQVFLDIILFQTIIEDDCLPMDHFAEYLLPHLLHLASDRVPNVRVLLAKTLRQTLLEKG